MRIAAFFAAVLMFMVGVTTIQVSRPATAEECDQNYKGVCIPAGAADVTCADIGAQVSVVGSDPYGLDADNDGIGCEEYPKAATSSTPRSNGATASASANSQGTCRPVFVGGKGMIDSCSSEHKDTSRVYPRKAGIPANGCAQSCPEAAGQTAPASATPGPAVAPTKAAGPIDSEYTAPIDTGRTPEPSQNCDRVSYPDICVPPAPPYLTCSDIPDRNFRVRAPDPHRFDADGNGIGCEEVRGPTIGR